MPPQCAVAFAVPFLRPGPLDSVTPSRLWCLRLLSLPALLALPARLLLLACPLRLSCSQHTHISHALPLSRSHSHHLLALLTHFLSLLALLACLLLDFTVITVSRYLLRSHTLTLQALLALLALQMLLAHRTLLACLSRSRVSCALILSSHSSTLSRCHAFLVYLTFSGLTTLLTPLALLALSLALSDAPFDGLRTGSSPFCWRRPTFWPAPVSAAGDRVLTKFEQVRPRFHSRRTTVLRPLPCPFHSRVLLTPSRPRASIASRIVLRNSSAGGSFAASLMDCSTVAPLAGVPGFRSPGRRSGWRSPGRQTS